MSIPSIEVMRIRRGFALRKSSEAERTKQREASGRKQGKAGQETSGVEDAIENIE